MTVHRSSLKAANSYQLSSQHYGARQLEWHREFQRRVSDVQAHQENHSASGLDNIVSFLLFMLILGFLGLTSMAWLLQGNFCNAMPAT